ncbi:hypothetical protein FACS189493_3450 [Spirochaetia bacterium]|nr:hypothetical protein FACS189493_3450 [Spirochaetia bacterium]
MRNYLLLFKMQLYQFGGINRMIHAHDPKEKKRAALMGLCAAVVIAGIILYVVMYSIGLAEMGLAGILPTLMLLTASLAVLALTFFKGSGMLFGLRDYDAVMSLPVSSSAVVMSRLSAVYLFNLCVSLLIMLPSGIIYGRYTAPGLSACIMLVLSLFFVPLIPMILALGVSTLITAVSVRFRRRNLISLLLYTAAVLAVIVFSFRLSLQSETMAPDQLANLGLAISAQINRVYPPAVLFSLALLNGDWIPYLLFVLGSGVIAAIFVVLTTCFYKKINTALFSHQVKSNYRVRALKTASPFMALYKREFRRLVSCTIYAVNTCIGMVMLLAASVALLFVAPAGMADQAELAVLIEMMTPVLPLVMALMVCMSSTTAVSLSLEGKNRWIMCSLPVDSITIFNAKIAVNVTVVIPASLVSGVLIAVALRTNVLVTVLLLIAPLVYGGFIAVLGMWLNVKFPKYDWASEYYAVKGTASLAATVFTGLAAAGIPLLVSVALPKIALLIIPAAMACVLVVTAILYGKLKRVRLFV